MLAEKNETVNIMLALEVPEEELKKRLMARAKVSGRTDDANPDVIQNRINVYQQETAPVKDYYAEKGKYTNVEFRLGEIEHLPIADNSANVIISNCVINLSPDKAQVFREAFRILKPGGRMAISDVVATIALPDEMKNDPLLIAGCMGNAALIEDLQRDIEAAGFSEISIQPKDSSREFIKDWAPGQGVENYVMSASIEGVKPV